LKVGDSFQLKTRWIQNKQNRDWFVWYVVEQRGKTGPQPRGIGEAGEIFARGGGKLFCRGKRREKIGAHAKKKSDKHCCGGQFLSKKIGQPN